MRILSEPISLHELQQLAAETFGIFVKAVVDVEKGILAVGGELHSDEEALLLEKGSNQDDLWGINLYPGLQGEDWIEFDSMINIRPLRSNSSRGVNDPPTRQRIVGVVNALIKR